MEARVVHGPGVAFTSSVTAMNYTMNVRWSDILMKGC